ncbi:lamin tail domain-containing protein [Thermoflexus sp.]|uniref:lamin tail domain-containing protein n=1 Tax=Thermoflexus sp. TaxID=1969742 RepID=UPI001755DE47|nr:lamin tail domain-containing protein [Thermoflexus sp.]
MPRISRLILTALLGLSGMILLALLPPVIQRSQAETPGVWITAVHPDGVFSGEPDEAVQLTAFGPGPVDLSGWSLRDRLTGTGGLRFPSGFTIAPGASIWVAHHALSFTLAFGHPPDAAVFTDGLETVRPVSGVWPGFANSGDEVALRDSTGALVDAVLYGEGYTETIGWHGPLVRAYSIPGTRSEGRILFRRFDPSTGLPIDTDTADDWASDARDPWQGRRVRFPGWAPERYERPLRITGTIPMTLIVAPDHAFEAVAAWIDGARVSIRGEMFTFEHPRLAERLAAAARRGVSVTMLLEGTPPGGITDDERYACRLLREAGGQCLIMRNAPAAIPPAMRRYAYAHAKFLVRDDQGVLIGTENLSPRAMPDDPKGDGTEGQRGVLVAFESPEAAAFLNELFRRDTDPIFRDVAPLTENPPPTYTPPITLGGSAYPVRFPEPIPIIATDLALIIGPEGMLNLNVGLWPLLREAGAGDRIEAQQLTMPAWWGPGAADPASAPIISPNLYLTALIEAADRGASVRLLLDRFYDDPTASRNNAATIAWIETLRTLRPTLSDTLQARLGNPGGRGLHNKMTLIRLRGEPYILLSSANGTETSHKLNRELTLLFRSEEGFAALSELFRFDWELARPKVYLPLVFQGYRPPHLLISEVLVNALGVDPNEEWVELYHPGGAPLDLSGYGIGDAAAPGDYEGMYRFPAGTVLGPGQVIVVAVSAQAFSARYGVLPNFELAGTDPRVPDLIPDPGWGRGSWNLNNTQDEVVLIGPEGEIDRVEWGSAPRCPAPPRGQSLERFPANRDMDTCADWRIQAFPSPGMVPR